MWEHISKLSIVYMEIEVRVYRPFHLSLWAAAWAGSDADFSRTPNLPASHRYTAGVCPEPGWLCGPSWGCSRLFGRALGMLCNPEGATAQLLKVLGSWSGETDIESWKKGLSSPWVNVISKFCPLIFDREFCFPTCLCMPAKLACALCSGSWVYS